ncbi:carbohydrate-binding protein [Paenibacillus sp. VCA1]|uniref:carbohydrate-binding protein n=1 Tax=Paenibacillus sp. VCA1 TaxID=3039148 RepID=UPI002870FAE1|nr:carbohydrate-binding protein [Paenibacillus sp. VCA1]MDR9852356.1 carbohydrate-binding protein [Paenibacillus sp. VCA1]
MSWNKYRACKLFAVPLAAVIAFGALSEAGGSTAHAFQASDGDKAMKAFNAAFWDPAAKQFWGDTNRKTYQGFWVEAELWEMVMDAYQHTSDPDLKKQLRAQIDDIFDGTVAKYGSDWTNNPFNDDIMWWVMGSARAYQITGEARYLDAAKRHFAFVYDTQWDDDFAGGGIWWLNSEHNTKNACINFPAAEAAEYMYDITKDPYYLDAATRIFRWGKTMLTDGNGKVFDRIETEKGAIQGATHYNQGTYIGAAVGLYRMTGDTTYLDDAVKAANFTKNNLADATGLLNYEGPNGDLKGGKTILMRNLSFLKKALDERGESKYKEFGATFDAWAAFNAEMAWSHRNPDGIVDGNWVGQLLSGTYGSWSSAAAVEALNVIKPMDAELRYAVQDPYKKIEAERYNIGKGFVLEGALEGSLQLGGIQPGHYAAYKNVDFGTTGAQGFIARAASATGGGNIEIRLDALDGPKVGTLNVEGTGGWNNYIDAVTLLKDDQGNPSTITGKHDVYLVFTKKNDQYLFNLNWFKFTAGDPTKTDAYAKLKAGDYDGSEGLGKNTENGYLDGIRNNAYASYKGIDFGSGASGISVHVSSGSQGGTIEVKLDSLSGPTVGTVDIPALGGWDKWVDIMGNIDDKAAAGVHDVYLVFHGAGGGDYPCNLDWFTFTTMKGKARDAYAKLEAEDNNGGVGFGTESGGGQTYLAGINAANNPYVMYNYVDFGNTSPSKFHVQAASATGGGTIEVRLDSMNGPVIAENKITGTGGWQNFKVFPADVTAPVTGKHIVFMLFKGTDYLFNVDKFTFGDPAVFTAPTPPVEPPKDNVPPGDVENVRISYANGRLVLTWDGPYDIDAQKVQITVSSGGQQIGDVIEVKRGVQTAAIPETEQGKDYSIRFKSIDTSGNVSKGITVESGKQSAFSLTVDGNAVKDGDAFEDDAVLTFQVEEGLTAGGAATLTLNGKEYTVNTDNRSLSIGLAGLLGEQTANVAVKDGSGHPDTKTFRFHVTASLASIQNLMARYAAAGDLGGPLVPQLTNALKQAQHQRDGGKTDQAVKQLQNFVKHLNNEAMSDHVKDSVKAVLNKDADYLIRAWQEGAR